MERVIGDVIEHQSKHNQPDCENYVNKDMECSVFGECNHQQNDAAETHHQSWKSVVWDQEMLQNFWYSVQIFLRKTKFFEEFQRKLNTNSSLFGEYCEDKDKNHCSIVISLGIFNIFLLDSKSNNQGSEFFLEFHEKW